MEDLKIEQICPYCNKKETDENMDKDSSGIVECSHCEKVYYCYPWFTFMGFQIEKICEECDEPDSDCNCS